MAVRNTLFGGGTSNWTSGDIATVTDLNDTFGTLGTALINATNSLTVPIGTIIMWHKSLVGIPTLPSGWCECDGSVLSDAASPMNGNTLPSLETTRLFLRGNSTSGGTGGSATHSHTYSQTSTESVYSPSPIAYNATYSASGSTDSQNNEPPYILMVPIIRVH